MTNYQQLQTSDDTNDSNRNNDTSSIYPVSQSTSTTSTYKSDLEAAFDESLDEEGYSYQETHALLPSPLPSFSTASSSSTTSSSRYHQRTVSTNDGVFANMSAKPESEKERKEETPPSYNDAALDATPPYWQTTIVAPTGMGDMVLVDGLPVGSIFVFFWNLLVSASFQFVGFMLTYLLHSSHAGKNGSRAGLGVSLVQFGFYIRSHGSLNHLDENIDDTADEEDDSDEQSFNADVVAYFFMTLGWLIIIGSVTDYLKAKHTEKIIMTDPSATAATIIIDRTV